MTQRKLLLTLEVPFDNLTCSVAAAFAAVHTRASASASAAGLPFEDDDSDEHGSSPSSSFLASPSDTTVAAKRKREDLGGYSEQVSRRIRLKPHSAIELLRFSQVNYNIPRILTLTQHDTTA